MKKKNKKVIEIGEGSSCRRCGQITVVRKHVHPPRDKFFYFKKWEYCRKCNAVYFKEEDKSSDWSESEQQDLFMKNIQ